MSSKQSCTRFRGTTRLEDTNQAFINLRMARTKVLITVTTYPLPSDKYQELVCTAGILEDKSWVRIYPIPLSNLIKNRFRKYDWIEIDLKKRDTNKDFRPESYNPVNADLRDLKILSKVDTKNNWEERKKYCLAKVYDNLGTLILIIGLFYPKKETQLKLF